MCVCYSSGWNWGLGYSGSGEAHSQRPPLASVQTQVSRRKTRRVLRDGGKADLLLAVVCPPLRASASVKKNSSPKGSFLPDLALAKDRGSEKLTAHLEGETECLSAKL